MAAILTALLISVAGVGSAAEPSWKVPVLMYHRIAPDSDLRNSAPGLVVRPQVFRAHVERLHDAGWRTITARQLARLLRRGEPVPPKTFVLTFDDGTQDQYDHARPVMERLGYVGTFYLITRNLRETGPHWAYRMSMEQARALAAAGHEIGNHTRTHRCLSGTTYATELAEIDGGADDVGAFVSRAVTLAWPIGCYDSSAAQAARDAGMLLAFTTRAGCHVTWAKRLTAPRVRVSPSTSAADLLATVGAC